MEAPPPNLSPQPSSSILFEGDSLTRFASKPNLDTWPWMRLTGAHYGYPEKVGDWIFCHRPDLDLTCRVGAVGGSILADIIERFPTATETYRPDIVVVTIGTNDANRSVPLSDFRTQAETYCQRLRDLCGGKVLYLGNPKFVLDPNAEDVARCEKIQSYAVIMAEAVEAHGGIAVDLGTMLKNKVARLQKLYSGHTIYHDGTHFNAVGHEIAAGIVLRALGLMSSPGDPDGQVLRIKRSSG
jgi:lysophospholipase L1-like esterase